MSNVFNIRRFGWYAQREFRENWKAYALGLVGMMALMAYFIYSESPKLPAQYTKAPIDIYPSLIIAVGLLVWVSSIFSLKGFSQTNERLRTLLLPVSNLERWLYAVSYTHLDKSEKNKKVNVRRDHAKEMMKKYGKPIRKTRPNNG